jgi:hypothetical protein
MISTPNTVTSRATRDEEAIETTRNDETSSSRARKNEEECEDEEDKLR